MLKNYLKSRKKGMTIVELMVAMSIFTVIITLAVGSFVAVSRMRLFALNLKESQQKVRIMSEMISRYARQADTVSVSSDNTTVEMKFRSEEADLTLRYAARFKISETAVGSNQYLMKYYECVPTLSNLDCLNGSPAPEGIDLFSGKMILAYQSNLTQSYFKLNDNKSLNANPADPVKGYVPSLSINLVSQLNNFSIDPYYNSDYFKVNTKVILENLK